VPTDRLTKKDIMVIELIRVFQPKASVIVYGGAIFVDGEHINA
jgi:hypothetical protein